MGQSGRRRLFGAANGAALAARIFGPADPHRRQVAQLAGRLPPSGAIRLERLRGFGAALGMLVTCGCARLDFPDGSHGILIAAGAPPVARERPVAATAAPEATCRSRLSIADAAPLPPRIRPRTLMSNRRYSRSKPGSR